MPSNFPDTDFQAFGLAARAFLPVVDFVGPGGLDVKGLQFGYSWQAVRYRYRTCVECNAEFKSLFALVNPSETWPFGLGDEELMYKLERCIYLFFMSSLSVFDSFAFCLYFFGNALEPSSFELISTPRKIDRKRVGMAFQAAFPSAAITGLILSLQSDPKLTANDARFVAIDTVRNLVGHRLSGRRTVQGWVTEDTAGVWTFKPEETWHLPGGAEKLVFDEELLQRHLDNITSLLETLSSAAKEFAEAQKAARNPSTEWQT